MKLCIVMNRVDTTADTVVETRAVQQKNSERYNENNVSEYIS